MNFKFWEKKSKKVISLTKDKYEFPCINCLVRAACDFSKPCDKLEMDNDKVKELFLEYNCCVDCSSETFYEGPSGGMATNVKCGGCGHWFNMALPLFIERIRTP